jgi:hypothetical protein
MNPADPALRALAERLLAEERANGKRSGHPACVQACDKLGALLGKLAGAAGYHSLLTRAVALAQAEAPALRYLHVLPDGKLLGLFEVIEGTDKEELERSEAVLVAHLLGLLYTFIGELLTRQLVKEAWPKIDLDLSSDSTTQ